MLNKIKKSLLNYAPTVLKAAFLRNAPFLYPLLEINPSACNIMITTRCNLKCIMCKQWREPLGKELSTGDWKNIIDDLKSNGIRNIHFTGGEPLLRKDIGALISYSADNGFVSGLTTNGSLLDTKLLESLFDAGLRSVALSIDALNEQYDKIRGQPGSFVWVKKAAYLISQMRQKKGMDAYINFTLMNNNISEFRDVKSFADELKLPVAICLLDKNSYIFDLEENKNEYWINKDVDNGNLLDLLNFIKAEKIKKHHSLLLTFSMVDFISRYFKDTRQARIPCASSQDRIILDPYGNLLGGCLSMGTFGNIKEKSFGKMRREIQYKRAKKNMFYKKCGGCSCGYQFNIRCMPHLLIKDLLFRIRNSILL